MIKYLVIFMNINVVFIFVLELVLLYLLAVILYFLMLLGRKLKIDDRLKPYTIHKNKKEGKVFDDVFLLYDNFISFVSKLLYKLKIFDTYSLKYQKYIKKEDKNKIDKMDFISKKVLLSLLYIFLVICFDMLKYVPITILQVLFSGLFGFFTLDLLLISEDKILEKERENDLLKAITIMNNSFKSGRSIMQSIELVSKELDSPLGLEFKKMYIDLTYGLSLDVVFKRFESRVKLEDAKYITTSLNILNETGGDIVKVFESVEKTFFNNKKLKDELNNLTASSKLLYYILLVIPVVFIIMIFALDSTYFFPLFTSSLGYLIIGICLVIYITYILIIKKIMNMNVGGKL